MSHHAVNTRLSCLFFFISYFISVCERYYYNSCNKENENDNLSNVSPKHLLKSVYSSELIAPAATWALCPGEGEHQWVLT